MKAKKKKSNNTANIIKVKNNDAHQQKHDKKIKVTKTTIDDDADQHEFTKKKKSSSSTLLVDYSPRTSTSRGGQPPPPPTTTTMKTRRRSFVLLLFGVILVSIMMVLLLFLIYTNKKKNNRIHQQQQQNTTTFDTKHEEDEREEVDEYIIRGSQFLHDICHHKDVYCHNSLVSKQRTHYYDYFDYGTKDDDDDDNNDGASSSSSSRSTRMINKGDIIVKIPRSLQIWDIDALRDNPYIKNELSSSAAAARRYIKKEPLSSAAYLACHLVYLLKQQQQQLPRRTTSTTTTAATTTSKTTRKEECNVDDDTNKKMFENDIDYDAILCDYLSILPTYQHYQHHHPVLLYMLDDSYSSNQQQQQPRQQQSTRRKTSSKTTIRDLFLGGLPSRTTSTANTLSNYESTSIYQNIVSFAELIHDEYDALILTAKAKDSSNNNNDQDNKTTSWSFANSMTWEDYVTARLNVLTRSFGTGAGSSSSTSSTLEQSSSSSSMLLSIYRWDRPRRCSCCNRGDNDGRPRRHELLVGGAGECKENDDKNNNNTCKNVGVSDSVDYDNDEELDNKEVELLVHVQQELDNIKKLYGIDLSKQGGSYAMVPILDMYNHHAKPNVGFTYHVAGGDVSRSSSHGMDNDDDAFIVKSLVDMAAPTVTTNHVEIFDSYGIRTDSNLYARYGFINGDGSEWTETNIAVFHQPQHTQTRHTSSASLTSSIQKEEKKMIMKLDQQLLRYLQYDDGYLQCVGPPPPPSQSKQKGGKNGQQEEIMTIPGTKATATTEAAAAWELKKLKFQYLQRIANISSRWTVRMSPRNPNAMPPPTSSSSSLSVTLDRKREQLDALLRFRKNQQHQRSRSSSSSKAMTTTPTMDVNLVFSTCRVITLTHMDYDGQAIHRLRDALHTSSRRKSNNNNNTTNTTIDETSRDDNNDDEPTILQPPESLSSSSKKATARVHDADNEPSTSFLDDHDHDHRDVALEFRTCLCVARMASTALQRRFNGVTVQQQEDYIRNITMMTLTTDDDKKKEKDHLLSWTWGHLILGEMHALEILQQRAFSVLNSHPMMRMKMEEKQQQQRKRKVLFKDYNNNKNNNNDGTNDKHEKSRTQDGGDRSDDGDELFQMRNDACPIQFLGPLLSSL